MKVWYDACTGKQIRYGTAIARRLRRRGHDVVFTTREHPDTVALAEILGEKPVVVGKYDPRTLVSRLEEGAKRMLEFSRIFKTSPPDLAIAHQSVEECRFAFGLNIPLIVTADTPYATAVNRLTIPLSTVLLTSEAIPGSLFKRYGARKIVRFKGVDEVAWIKDASWSKRYDFKRPLITVRQIEARSAYAVGKNDVTLEAARNLSSLGTVVFLSRYRKPKNEKFTVLDEFVDSASLAGQSDLVVSAGGTIAREAALQGVPSIVISEFGRIEVNDYLGEKGFPIYTVKSSEVMQYAKRCLRKKFNVEAKMKGLENPVDVVEKIMKEDLNLPVDGSNE